MLNEGLRSKAGILTFCQDRHIHSRDFWCNKILANEEDHNLIISLNYHSMSFKCGLEYVLV